VHIGSTLTVYVRGRLDAAAGAALLDAVRAGLVPGVDRLDVDLRHVSGFTAPGADSLVLIRDVGYDLADGVHYRTLGTGGDALLAAFATPDGDA
jgi:hypothetical protein